MISIRSVLYLILLTNSCTKGTPASHHFKGDIKIESDLTVKSLKDDWKIDNHEKTINRHSWILIPENEHLHRFKRTVPYDDKTFPYKDVGTNKHSEKKIKNNRITKNNNIENYISNNTSNSINNNSTHKPTTKKKKYHRLAHSVHVQSDIRYRYATTLITSKVSNPENTSREVFMSVILPETAFISRFAIQVEDQVFVAFVKEKEDAWRQYQDAVTKGKTAGHVGISARHSNHFRVSVNTEAKSTVIFHLLYEELLQRKQGMYDHAINLTPRQKLKHFSIDVKISESRNLINVTVPALRRHEISVEELDNTKTSEYVKINRLDDKRVKVHYKPNVKKLQKLLNSNHALKFSVQYDVERKDEGGEIEVIDGYFVHFVAPENLPPMSKHVVFVLDTSGSMSGKKMQQTKNAMKTIITDLREEDSMTIIEFDDDINVWTDDDGHKIFDASPDKKERAIEYVEGLESDGGTNINDALMEALSIIGEIKAQKRRKESQYMIIFLTDGQATTGVTDTTEISLNVRERNTDPETAIFTLSFGRNADFSMLKLLSLQNHAFSRKIYIAADASLQLEGFYKEVSNPILSDVEFKYPENEILEHSLTATNFHTYYQGSEMVVAGQLPTKRADKIEYEIVASQAGGAYSVSGTYNTSSMESMYPEAITETVFDFVPKQPNTPIINVNFLERLWAYMTIQDLLKRVSRGELSSCGGMGPKQGSVPEDIPDPSDRSKRSARRTPVVDDEEDEEYYYDDLPQIFDDNQTTQQHSETNAHGEVYTETPAGVADIMDQLGDADIVICDNLERALYLSLKYEFVTPLTSLVVVKPDSEDYGDFGEAGLRERQRDIRQFDIRFASGKEMLLSSNLVISVAFIINCLLLVNAV